MPHVSKISATPLTDIPAHKRKERYFSKALVFKTTEMAFEIRKTLLWAKACQKDTFEDAGPHLGQIHAIDF